MHTRRKSSSAALQGTVFRLPAPSPLGCPGGGHSSSLPREKREKLQTIVGSCCRSNSDIFAVTIGRAMSNLTEAVRADLSQESPKPASRLPQPVPSTLDTCGQIRVATLEPIERMPWTGIPKAESQTSKLPIQKSKVTQNSNLKFANVADSSSSSWPTRAKAQSSVASYAVLKAPSCGAACAARRSKNGTVAGS